MSFKNNNTKNIKELSLSWCKIKDYSFLSNFGKLEKFTIQKGNICDISFLEKNKDIKELILYSCKNIKDFSVISNLEKLEK